MNIEKFEVGIRYTSKLKLDDSLLEEKKGTIYLITLNQYEDIQ